MTSAAGGCLEAFVEAYLDWCDPEMAMQPVSPKKSQHAGPNPPTNMAHTDEGLTDGPPDELDYWSPDVKYAFDYEVYHRPSRMVLDVLEANKLEGWVSQSWTDIEGITRVEKVQADFVIRRKR